MANLVELYDLVIQAQSFNGVPLSHGHVYVYALGRTKLMDTWSDIDGESLNTNPVILDNAGQAHIYVSDDFDYTLVFTDEFDNEIFSVDKYLLSKGEHSHADVAVAPSEHIGVSSYHVGEVTVYVPYLTGEVGKTYEGIDPIVVNNTLNRISANHIPLGVQDPLYFVEDSETACIIGCSAQTEIPAELSGKWDEASDAVIANSAQWAEGTEYEAGSYVDIDGHTINVTGLQPEGDYAYNSALSSKLDVTALPQDLVHSGDLSAYYPASNPSGFITGVDLSDYATTAQLDEKLDKTDSSNFYPMEGNPSGFLTAHQSLQGYATEQWVENKGYLTGVDIPESANWNSTYNTVHDNSGSWTGSTANQQIPVTGINGIKISESGDQVVFEVSGNYLQNTDLTIVDNKITEISGIPLSAGDELPESVSAATDYITATSGAINATITNVSENSAAWGGDVLPISARDGIDLELSGNVLWIGASALNDALTGKQDITGMTAYQPVGDYLTTADSAEFYTTANESGFITGVDLTPYMLAADMTAYQIAGSYLSSTDSASFLLTSDSANFYTTANESGYITGVPAGTMNESAFSYDASDNITAYNGSAFKAGGEVPQGVMVESGLEYNANNKISGYNGSAFAGDEQVQSDWTVTAVDSPAYILNKPTEKNLIAGANVTITESNDDVTIETTEIASGLQLVAGPGVTLTVSGSNIIAGLDETVLWEGESNSACNLSENPLNFEYLEIYASEYAETASQVTKLYCTGQPSRVHFNYNAGNINSQFVMAKGTLTTNSFNVTDTICFSIPFTDSTTAITINRNQSNHMNAIKKIVGINRISS